MHFLVSRGFVLAVHYIVRNCRAPVNNPNPVLAKLLFIYFLGLQSNKFPGRPLIHRPKPSFNLCGFYEEILLNTEYSDYSFHCSYTILPFLSCSAQPGSHSCGIIPERQKLGKVCTGNWRPRDARTAKDRFRTQLYLQGYERPGTSSMRGNWSRPDLSLGKFWLHILLLQVYYAVLEKLLNTYLCLKLYWELTVYKPPPLKFTKNHRNNPATSSRLGKGPNYSWTTQTNNVFILTNITFLLVPSFSKSGISH